MYSLQCILHKYHKYNYSCGVHTSIVRGELLKTKGSFREVLPGLERLMIKTFRFNVRKSVSIEDVYLY